MRVGSLFSGCGGFELGLERAGFHAAWFVENEPHAQAILKKHWPETPIYGDITTVDFTTVQPIDILTGGFPCQDISNAGKRAGITGSRSSLWKYYLEAIRVLRPRIVLAENVSALIDRGLDVVLADLASVGYDAEWHCFPASSVGAPHRRDRIIVMAYPNGSGCLHRQAPEQSDSRGQYAQCDAREGGQDVAHSNIRRWDERHKQQYDDDGKWEIRKNESNDKYEIRSVARSSSTSGGWWTTEPRICRVVNGLPLRMDRIKRLGNAAVPQWAQAIGEAIKETEGW